jgi:hypothetical protein
LKIFTMNKTLTILVLLCMLCRGVLPGLAEGEKKSDHPFNKRYALIIGVSKYKEFKDLKVAENDAKSVAKVTREKGYDHVALLLNEQATRENIGKEMDKIRSKLTRNDLFGFFFAGHGQRATSKDGAFEGYLIPHECRKDHVAQDGFPMHKLKDSIAKMPNKHIALIIDACGLGWKGRSPGDGGGCAARGQVRDCGMADTTVHAGRGTQV